MINQRPIGVFDSGVGGLTVVRALREVMPKESVIYIGDTARVPYGTRSRETVTKFALEILNQVLKSRVKLVVVACNTITAIALDKVRQRSSVPVVGVIEPTVAEAARATKHKVIGVAGTAAAIGSGVYQRALSEKNSRIQVVAKAMPMLVPIVEEGLYDHKVADLMVKEYFQEMKENRAMDTVILGCTHYPMLRGPIEKFLGVRVKVIDSAQPTAKAVKALLNERDLAADGAKPTQVYFTSDEPGRSHDIAKALLGEELELKRINI